MLSQWKRIPATNKPSSNGINFLSFFFSFLIDKESSMGGGEWEHFVKAELMSPTRKQCGHLIL